MTYSCLKALSDWSKEPLLSSLSLLERELDSEGLHCYAPLPSQVEQQMICHNKQAFGSSYLVASAGGRRGHGSSRSRATGRVIQVEEETPLVQRGIHWMCVQLSSPLTKPPVEMDDLLGAYVNK